MAPNNYVTNNILLLLFYVKIASQILSNFKYCLRVHCLLKVHIKELPITQKSRYFAYFTKYLLC